MSAFARYTDIDHSGAQTPTASRPCFRLLSRPGSHPERRTPDPHHAFCIASSLPRADRDGTLASFFKPDLLPAAQAVAEAERWIMGVPSLL